MTDEITLAIAARDAMIRELSGKLEASKQLLDMYQAQVDDDTRIIAELRQSLVNMSTMVSVPVAEQKPAPMAVPEGFTERHRDVIRMALFLFHSRAMRQADAAARDKDGQWFAAGDVDRFLSDAKTAEEARALLAAAPQEKGQ